MYSAHEQGEEQVKPHCIIRISLLSYQFNLVGLEWTRISRQAQICFLFPKPHALCQAPIIPRLVNTTLHYRKRRLSPAEILPKLKGRKN
jgi:hypothetical protein